MYFQQLHQLNYLYSGEYNIICQVNWLIWTKGEV